MKIFAHPRLAPVEPLDAIAIERARRNHPSYEGWRLHSENMGSARDNEPDLLYDDAWAGHDA